MVDVVASGTGTETADGGTVDAQPDRPRVPAVAVSRLSKTFGTRQRAHRALDDVSLTVERGEMVALIGASGSGKSTLLRHLSGLVSSDGGEGCEASVLGCRVQGPRGVARDIRRTRRRVGFIFQQFNLVGRLSLLTNVCLGMVAQMPPWRSLIGRFTHEEKLRAMAALARVGMDRFAAQRASTLSGGQQQRAAIARAMVQGAEVLLADEPIASLDPASSNRVMQALRELNRDGVTVVVCLHQVEFARRFCPRAVALRDGRIVYDGESDRLDDDFLGELYGGEAADATYSDTRQIAGRSHEQSIPELNPVLAEA